ncbi:MAG: fasciclin domain-containing protein [Bacteroidota bacterium]
MSRYTLLLLPLLVLTACDSADPDPLPPASSTITDLAVDTPALSTLVTALQTAQLDDDLMTDGPFTVFAPTNAAFDALPDGALDNLIANPQELGGVLTYHVVPGQFATSDLSNGQILTTLEGEQLTVSISGGIIRINNAAIGSANVEASNGIVHIVNDVIAFPDNIPALAIGTPSLSTLVTALQTANLVGDLDEAGPFTVFAPNNDAFSAVNGALLNALLGDVPALDELLKYHVVSGELFASDLSDGQTLTTLQGDQLTVTVNDNGVFVDGTRVIAANINANNGVVHVVEDVLVAPVDIVDAASLLGFSTLVQAAGDAGLAGALRGDGPLTVFAPSNQAFVDANASSLNTSQVANILRYHVVPSLALSTSLSNDQSVSTLLMNEALTIDIAGSTITIEGAQSNAEVQVADVVVGNGVIHAVDAVLLPSSF